MPKPFDVRRLFQDRDDFIARLELAFALERRKPLRPPPAPPEPPTAEADKKTR
ncbi:MAG: hypothetical protein ACAI38_20795 [Myxococcota bacterium]|nr:hypothetical protein [Myxococcota bacterium]